MTLEPKMLKLSVICTILLGTFIGVPVVTADAPPTPGPHTAVSANQVFLPYVKGGLIEWPTLAANPQRTSWNEEEVRGSLGVQWYRPIEPFIPYKIQPIAANGKIYVSTARGLYAFNASNGNLDWVYPTELPLGHSPTIAVVNGKRIAYVGGYDHKLYALDAFTGQPVAGYTPFEAKAGFGTNPLVANNTIYAGNRDGNFYALDAVTGNLKWSYQTGSTINYSAALKNGTLYFASNDSYAYALNASNGSLVWKSSKLAGAGFESFWPVIYTDKSSGTDYVILTGAENYRLSEYLTQTNLDVDYFYPGCHNLPGPPCPPNGTLIGPVSSAPLGDPYWSPGTLLIDASAIKTYYETYPKRHYVFILNASNGQEYTFDSDNNGKMEYAPWTWSGVTSSGNKFPPVVNGMDNIPYNHTIYMATGWIPRGDITGWKFGTHFVSQVADSHAIDEPMAYSSGGRLIYWSLCCDRQAGAFDVSIPYGQPNRIWQYWAYNLNNLAPDYDMMYNDGNSTLYNNSDGWQAFSGSSQSKNGVYGKHESAQSAPVPYKGMLYVLKGNALMALSPNPPPGSPTKLALATVVSATSTTSAPIKATLAQRLESEILKMVAIGHLRPGYHSAGFIDLYGDGNSTSDGEFGEIFDYFQNPADTVYTLLLAYPYLSGGAQAQVKSYLQTTYGPGATYDFTKIVHVGWGSGTAREAFDIPPEEWGGQSGIGSSYHSPLNPSTQPICGQCGYWHNFPPFSFYAAWKYAQIVGNNDTAFAANIFNLMLGKMEAPPGDLFLTHKPYFINLYAAGYLGYLQLKQLAGLGGDVTVQGYYSHMLSLRVGSFSKDTYYWATDTNGFGLPGLDYNRTLSVARNFMFLTPEIADYMSQNIQPQVQTAVNEYNTVAPYWFVSKFDGSFGEGTLEHLYNPPAILQAKAYILKQPYAEVVKWLDVPAFSQGDLFYIQNLAAALSAH